MSDEWHYSHKNSQGYDVNAYGYDKNGIYRGTQIYTPNNSNSNNNTEPNTIIGVGVFALFALAMIIIEKIGNFIEENSLFIELFLGLFVIFAIIHFIFVKKTRIRTLIIIIIAIGVFFSIFSSYPMKKEEFLKFIKKPSFTQTELLEKKYAVVTSDALNIRSGPSTDNEIIGRLTKETIVEIIDNSKLWWKIKSGNIEGFVDSDYLQLR